MPEVQRIADDLARGFDGEPWHGPSVASVLQGLTAAEASARPLTGAHSIWELVLHMTGWTREVARRLYGSEPAMPAGGDWPAPPPEPRADSWERARADLAAAHGEVLGAMATFPEDRLDETVGSASRDLPLGAGVSFRVMLHGLAQHHAYHAGQIAMLRKGAQTR